MNYVIIVRSRFSQMSCGGSLGAPQLFTWPTLTWGGIINLFVAGVHSHRLPSSLIGPVHLVLMKEPEGKPHVCVCVCVCMRAQSHVF